MSIEIYFDNAATTQLSQKAADAFRASLDVYGNPSSLHTAGIRAKKLINDSRAVILKSLAVREGQGSLIFTSSGSEANALALFGTAFAKERRTADRIIIGDSEHPSVVNTAKRLAALGFDVVKIPTKSGVLDFSALNAALEKPVSLASLMLVNNETGALYNIANAFKMIKERYPDAVTHTDASQGYLKLPFSPIKLSADMATISGHKVHAPKGAAALFVSKEIITAKKIIPHTYGGGQEGGFRAGTENVAAIAAFGAAVSEGFDKISENMRYFDELYNYAVSRFGRMGIIINRPNGEFVKHIISIGLPRIKSQTMLNFLSGKGIYLSSGSACSSNSKKISETLLAFGLDETAADFTLRVSFSVYNTKADIDTLCTALECGISVLIRAK